MAKRKLGIFKNETDIRKVIKDYFGERAFFVEHGRYGGSTGVTDCFLTYPNERTIYIELKLERKGKIKVRPSQSRNARLLNKFKQPHLLLIGIEGKSDYCHVRYPEYKVKDEKLIPVGNAVFGKGHKSLVEDVKAFAENPFIEGDFATDAKRAIHILKDAEGHLRNVYRGGMEGLQFDGVDKELIDKLQKSIVEFTDCLRRGDSIGIGAAVESASIMSMLCSMYFHDYIDEEMREDRERSSE